MRNAIWWEQHSPRDTALMVQQMRRHIQGKQGWIKNGVMNGQEATPKSFQSFWSYFWFQQRKRLGSLQPSIIGVEWLQTRYILEAPRSWEAFQALRVDCYDLVLMTSYWMYLHCARRTLEDSIYNVCTQPTIVYPSPGKTRLWYVSSSFFHHGSTSCPISASGFLRRHTWGQWQAWSHPTRRVDSRQRTQPLSKLASMPCCQLQRFFSPDSFD